MQIKYPVFISADNGHYRTNLTIIALFLILQKQQQQQQSSLMISRYHTYKNYKIYLLENVKILIYILAGKSYLRLVCL